MIMKVKVRDYKESRLQAVLPKDLELDLEGRIILLVGENGRGKTSFLKMLNSALIYGTCLDIDSETNLYPFLLLSQERNSEAKPLSEHCSVFFEPESEDEVGGPPSYLSPGIYMSKIVDTVFSSIRRFYKGFDVIEVDTGTQFTHEGVRSFFVNPGQQFSSETCLNFSKELSRRTSVKRYIKGYALDATHNHYFEEYSFSLYFLASEESIRRNRFLPESSRKHLDILADSYHPDQEISPDSQALLLLDEPTTFMSYRRKYAFRQQLSTLIKDFPGMRAVITTNDPVLIENNQEGWSYLDFDETPIKYKTKISRP